MNEIIKRFAESTSIRNVQDILRCGYELEFQGIDGYSKDNSDSGGEIDWEAVSEAISNDFDGYGSRSINGRSCAYEIMAILLDRKGHSIHDLPNNLRDKLASAQETLYDEYREEAENSGDWSEYRDRENFDPRDHVSYSGNAEVEVKDDSSVSGGEVATIGGIKIVDFIESSKNLFARNDFDIDANCSFHIHLSIEGVEHHYGERSQAEMLAYILKHVEELPENVQRRIERNNSYYQSRINTNKYSAIHFHGKTWEFRLFGHVEEYKEGIKCLNMAYKAMRHAYRCRLDKRERLVDELELFKSDLLGQSVNETNIKLKRKNYKSNELRIGA